MDLNAIATFVKGVEAGSFVAAARTAGGTKATVARRAGWALMRTLKSLSGA